MPDQALEADHSVIDTDVATWDKVMAVNVRGVFLGSKFAIPAMEASGGGSIINIASFGGDPRVVSVPQDATPRLRAPSSR